MPQALVGEIVPGFILLSASGACIRVSDYRGKRNLVLIFCGAGNSASVRGLVRRISELRAAFVAEEAEVFALVHGVSNQAEDLDRSLNPPFTVLSDKEGHAHELFGLGLSEQHALPVVCVIDRFGELRNVSRAAEAQRSSFAHDILEWVRYINLECPE